MARAVRIEYPGAVYHGMARGNHGQDIFRDDTDRGFWLETLGEACEQTGWVVHAYVLMCNHRLTAVGERTVGDGALYAGDACAQPDEAASWAEARATPAQIAEVGMKGKPHEKLRCHNYRNDPFHIGVEARRSAVSRQRAVWRPLEAHDPSNPACN